MEIASTLAGMRAKRRKHDRDLMHVSNAQMNIQTSFTFETMMTGGDGKTTGAGVGWMFLRRADHLEEHAIQIEGLLRNRFGISRNQAQLIWAANQVTRGELHAALVGLTDDDLDARDGLPDDEWSLRQILEHLIVVERYYLLDSRHALAQFHAGEPHGDLPQDELVIERPGATLSALIEELEGWRAEAVASFSNLSDAELRAPARWEVSVDLRFLQMRFGHHEREHTDQILKLRAYRDRQQSEAERLLGLCWKQHGILEGHLIGAPDEILDRVPGNGEWPIRRILKHIGSAESYFRRVIRTSLEVDVVAT